MLKVVTILGTRPEIIKFSEVIKILDKYTNHTIVHTGQNYDFELSEAFFEGLELRPPDYYLDVAGDSVGVTIGNIISKSYTLLDELKPHAVLVEGHFLGNAETDADIIPLFPHGTKSVDKELRKLVDDNNIPIPEKYECSTIKEAREKYASRNTDFGCVGVVVKDLNQGWRSKIRNPVYEEVKQLRGNIPNLQYLYLVLRQSGSVKKYLEYYREHAKEFKEYRNQIHSFTQTLYLNYVDCFIKKKALVNTYPHQFKVCMTALHKLYLDTMMYKGRHIHKGVVINFFNSMPPQRQMYLLNYNFRK